MADDSKGTICQSDAENAEMFDRIGLITYMRGYLGIFARRGSAHDCAMIREAAKKHDIDPRDIDLQSARDQAQARGHTDAETFLSAWLAESAHGK